MRTKSPINNVGLREPDGIRKGSNKNERKRKTISKKGKNERAYSTQTGNVPTERVRLGAKAYNPEEL